MKNKLKVRVFTRSKNKITLIAQGIGQTWFNDTSNDDIDNKIAMSLNKNSMQRNHFYNYRYEK